jgi:natural product precursor
MKKLKLNNLKVVKLTSEEKKVVKGGYVPEWDTSHQCNATSGPYVSWCNGC